MSKENMMVGKDLGVMYINENMRTPVPSSTLTMFSRMSCAEKTESGVEFQKLKNPQVISQLGGNEESNIPCQQTTTQLVSCCTKGYMQKDEGWIK